MIVCFSGTGNSRKVADLLHEALGDEVVRFSPGDMSHPEKVKLSVGDGRVIWIFPVHGWGLPRVVENAINRVSIDSDGAVSHFMACSCGDDIALTDKQWRRLISRRGWRPLGAYSVQMPNNYVAMKGFDVDSPQVAAAKLENLPARIKQVAAGIASKSPETDVVRGKYAWIKSKIIYPWFSRRMTRTKPFHTLDSCVGCGKCKRNCPIMAIDMAGGRPVWKIDRCIMCLRCYHSCPQHAIAYGKATDGKGQYLCPGFSLQS